MPPPGRPFIPTQSSAFYAVKLRTPPIIRVTGAATGSALVQGGESASLDLSLAASGVTAATYGDATHVAQFAVNAAGLITSASNVPITAGVTSLNTRLGAIVLAAGSNITITEAPTNTFTFAASGGSGTVTHTAGALTAGQLVIGNGVADITVGNLSGDVTTSGGTATTLASTAVTPGSYTNTDLTVDAKGRITAASSGTAVTSVSFHPGYVTGRYYSPPFIITLSAGVVAANTLVAYPFYVSVTTTFTKILINVTSLSTGGNVRLGIYSESGGQPNTLLYDSGSITLAAGINSGTTLPALSPGWYYLAYVGSSAAPSVTTFTVPSTFLNLFGTTGLTDTSAMIVNAFAFAALPNPFPAVTYATPTTSVMIWLQK